MAAPSPGPDPSLALEFCGLRFASPVVLLSGCVGFGEEYTRVKGFSNRDAGAICLKGTTGVLDRTNFSSINEANTDCDQFLYLICVEQ